ncbi:hypothetical protein IE4872_PC00094 (plasmid) [Rhizobium gallicum]|uniref:Uncharacterized protein n=1 Tax=Rhizobium gallicum TaxID=56730 RepID=A0A1L5NQE1_9HYPH|nr:hypothetical protein IE4872_PC00094 [Rhizobium gallicum]
MAAVSQLDEMHLLGAVGRKIWSSGDTRPTAPNLIDHQVRITLLKKFGSRRKRKSNADLE